MSNVGQAVLTIGGTVVGAFFGNPQLGYLIGSMAGQALFPTDLGTISGPRLNSLNVQTSTVGTPIPIVFGAYALSGNLIWSSGIIETVSKKRQGGKGGPTQTVKTYSYRVSCAVGVCEGVIGGITRIWADAKLIYDIRPQRPDENDVDYAARVATNAELANQMEIYLGDEVQTADPTIESYEGVGNVSAFRGLAYVVFTDFQLEQYGNRVPNFRFEVNGLPDCVIMGVYHPGELLYWNTSPERADPRQPFAGAYEYSESYGIFNDVLTNDISGAWTGNLQGVLESQSATIPYTDMVRGYTTNNAMTNTDTYRNGYWPCAVGVYPSPPIDAPADLGGRMLVDLYFSCLDNVDTYCLGPTESRYTIIDANPGQPYHFVSYQDTNLTDNPGIWETVALASPNTIGGIPARVALTGATTKNLYIEDTVVKVKRKLIQPFDPCYGATQFSDDNLWCYVGGIWIRQITDWAYTNAGLYGLQNYEFSGTPDTNTHFVTKRPITNQMSGLVDQRYQFRPSTHPEHTQEFWEAEYAKAVANGDLPSGWTYGNEYPRAKTGYWYIEIEQCEAPYGFITLGEIVRAICLRCGLTDEQLDVSELTEFVDGYAIGAVMTGRDAIQPLRSFGFFDCVESAGVLRWPVRGKPAVKTLTADELGAHWADSGAIPSVETDRAQSVELPIRVRVHYAQTAMNYEPGEQSASRITAPTVHVQDVELAIAMSDTKAAQIADVLLYERWVARNTHRFSLGTEHLDLEPADAVTLPIDGRQERVRIVDIGNALPGLLTVMAVRDDDGTYVSYAVGAPNANAGSGSSAISIPGTGEATYLDLPLLRDEDNDPGYYAVVEAVGGNTWGGAFIFRSADGGVTYEQVAVASIEGTVGELDAALPVGITTAIDEVNELLVTLNKGELESVVEASLLAGYNAAAIGADGRWEIIQFRDAELVSGNSWRLTGLLRGRRGTEWAVGTSQLGDTFVLLDEAVVRVPLSVSSIGAERQLKAVLSGTTVEAATPVTFVGEGVALKPFAVIDVTGTRDSSGDLTIEWVRRGRIGSELPSGSDIPLSEETEAYEVDIYDGSNVVRTLSTTSQSVVYTAIEQEEDFGSPIPDTVNVSVYQLSAVVGRGYSSEATV